MESIGNYPFLVKVQSIDIHSLDFKTGTFKPRNVTCVETSNLLIFVGVTSGTVYVFGRESLAFKFMVPFTGGKVCSISCCENERQLAIGSIRGIVSIYELVKEPAARIKSQNKPTKVAFFKYISTIELHKGNEITELLWSPNGKFLFAGDTLGLVSQTDVGTYDENARPATQIILKLKSRIIQIHFLFPILAIATGSSVFLGDIENEDFARVHFGTKEIQATGLALVLVSDAALREKYALVYLYVSEMSTGMLHRFNLQGQLVESKLITVDTKTQSPISSFDPVSPISDNAPDPEAPNLKSKRGLAITSPNISLGKLLLSDDNFLLSVSHKNLYVIEPTRMELVYWNDEFPKIHNSKLQSNYVFLWSSTRIIVLSLTSAFPYALQLFNAGTNIPFKRWVEHCLVAVGWTNTEEPESDSNKKVIEEFCSAFHLLIDDQNYCGSSFQKEISNCLPFDIPEETQDAKDPVSPILSLVSSLRKFLDVFEQYKSAGEETISSRVLLLWTGIESFYSALVPNWNTMFDIPDLLQLFDVIQNVEAFCTEPSIANLYQDCNSLSLDELQVLNINIMSFFRIQTSEDGVFCNLATALSPINQICFFSSFVLQDFVMNWFTSFGRSNAQIVQDALHADFLILLSPFLSPEMRAVVLNPNGICRRNIDGFCSWLTVSTFLSVKPFKASYEVQLKSLFSIRTVHSYEFFKTIFSTIYGELLTFTNTKRSEASIMETEAAIHNLVSLIYFTSSSKDLALEGFTHRDGVLSLIISKFPFKHFSREEITQKLYISLGNAILLQMFEEACLFVVKDAELCRCGIPLDCSGSCTDRISDGSNGPTLAIDRQLQLRSGGTLSSFFSVIAELVIQRRIDNYNFSSKQAATPQLGPQLHPFPLTLILKLNLYERFWLTLLRFLEETLLLDIVLRSASCALLSAYPITQSNVSALLGRREYIKDEKRCSNCGDELIMRSSLSLDCIGIAIFNDLCQRSLEKFLNFVKSTSRLNRPGAFSLRFYQVIAAGRREVGGCNVDAVCDPFHGQ